MRLIKYTTLILLLAFFISCKKSNQEIQSAEGTKSVVKNNTEDYFNVIKDSAIVFLNPSNDEIELLKKQKGEDDFYTIADDENYYFAMNNRILEEQKISILSTNKKLIKFNSDNIIFDKQKNENKWSILIYKKNKPLKIVSSVDLYIELSENVKKNKKISYDLILNNSISGANSTQDNELSTQNISEIRGVWRVDCGNTLTTLEISNFNAYVSVYSNTVFINSKINTSDNEPNTYYLKFLNQDESLANEENKIDGKKISKDKNIAKLVFENNKLKLYWYGLFNQDTKKIEYDKNTPFDIESENQKPIELSKCE